MTTQTILLTGAAGFVGWKTAELLLQHGHTVVGIDNLNDYYAPALKGWRLAQVGDEMKFVDLDVEDAEGLERIFREYSFDAVINLAARAGVRASIENPGVYFRTNVDGSVNLMEAMRRHGTKKYVLASTSSLYAGQPLPFREDLPVNTPISPYAASKKGAEVAAYTWHHLFGIDVTIVRYFTVYGPAGRPDMSPLRFLHWMANDRPIQLFGDGRQRRDFTYIDDIAQGTVAALRPLGYEIINLGGGNKPVAILDMIAAFEAALGKRAKIDFLPFHEADMKETQADNRRAAELLDWKPGTLPAEGFRRTAEWYLENRTWLDPIL